MFCVREKDSKHRFHYHLIIEKPTHLSDMEFRKLILNCWLKTKFGYYQIHLSKLPDEEEDYWLRYITKKKTKADPWTSIDWENCTNS